MRSRDVGAQRRAQQVAARAEVVVDEPAVDAGLVGDLAEVEPGQHTVALEQRQGGPLQGALGGGAIRLGVRGSGDTSCHERHDSASVRARVTVNR